MCVGCVLIESYDAFNLWLTQEGDISSYLHSNVHWASGGLWALVLTVLAIKNDLKWSHFASLMVLLSKNIMRPLRTNQLTPTPRGKVAIKGTNFEMTT